MLVGGPAVAAVGVADAAACLAAASCSEQRAGSRVDSADPVNKLKTLQELCQQEIKIVQCI